MATDKTKIQDIDAAYNEAYNAQGQMLTEFEEDDGFYLGGHLQWNPNDLMELQAQGRTVITKNKVAKPINLVTGYYRQNKMDLKYHPTEGGDQETSDIYTELAKWVVDDTGGRENLAFTFGDCARVGLGWNEVKMNYTRGDPLYGDIDINLCNKYNIMFDPYTTDPTLEDCNYVLRYGYPSKEVAAMAYPDSEKDIMKIKTRQKQKFLVQEFASTADQGLRVNIIEKWYRAYDKITIIIDPISLESYEWKSGKRKFNQLMEAHPELAGRVQIMDVKIPKIKLLAHAEESILLWDDYAPEGFSRSMYPFIPMFCYYIPNYNDWTYKVQGIIRNLKDPQREINKLNAIYMDAAMTVPNSGWVHESNAVVNPEELQKTGAGVGIEVRQGKGLGNGLWQVQPPQVNSVLSQLYQQYQQDILEIGPNADLLGSIGADQGASSADASGLALQLRAKQGLMSLQNPFDGAALAHRMLGKYLLEMMNKWPKEKIERILGRSLPPMFDRSRTTSRFDCIVDTQTSSSTYQLAAFAQLQSLVQHGIQIPQQILREAANIPFKLKQAWAQLDQQNAQQQLQARQQEIQIEMAKIQAAGQEGMKIKAVEMEGKKQVENIKSESQKEIEHMKDINKLAVEKLKLPIKDLTNET